MTETLSTRGRALQSPGPASLIHAYAARDDQYNEETNPFGTIDLSISENRLSLPALHKKLCDLPPAPPSWLLYDSSHGSPEFLSALADFFTRHFFPPNSKAPPQSFLATSGAGAALDLLATALCDVGDVILIPSPSYGGFSRDLSVRAGAVLLPVPTTEDGRVTASMFQTFWGTMSHSQRSRVRVLLITSPHNPTGEVLLPDEIRALEAWANMQGLHVIFDEAYACSVYAAGKKFCSVAHALDGDLGNKVHIVWTFSKDFCWSGARVGVIYSQNAALLTALKPELTYLAGVSRSTQWAVTKLLDDRKWVDDFMTENLKTLLNVSNKVKTLLDEYEIEYFPAEAGLFLWIDLRPWMKADSVHDEMALWKSLVDEKVLLTPGNECFGLIPGFFRLCFAAVDELCLQVAFKRLTRTVLEPLQDW